ncbi:hypothetical protein CEXT_810701 [Caerostris extrusa]|uniref:Uncharacterized protein n=1 Tax=Caerostris extrusa TaxID=172846 RepID=A0AAV4QK02_CAEEX|nr:hypothetical protein CEXT_810701 [Caerostris extrusa]
MIASDCLRVKLRGKFADTSDCIFEEAPPYLQMVVLRHRSHTQPRKVPLPHLRSMKRSIPEEIRRQRLSKQAKREKITSWFGVTKTPTRHQSLRK